MVLMTAAAIAALAGGAMSSYGQRKAAKKQERQMHNALNAIKQGGTDAMGNSLSASKSGKWKYDLNYGGQQAANFANNANASLGAYRDKSAEDILRNEFFANHYADRMTARANQNAAMRSGARTNSNLGKIAESFGRAGSEGLRQNYIRGMKASNNPALYNANMRANLAQSTAAAQLPIQNIQNGLQQMTTQLNPMLANAYQGLGAAQAAVPTSATMAGDFLQGAGGVGFNIAAMLEEQKRFQQLLTALNNQTPTVINNSGNTGA